MSKFNISGGFKRGAMLVFAVGTGFSMMGCEGRTNRDDTSDYALPKNMQDCQIVRLTSDSRQNLTIIRCPLSDTTAVYRDGKHPMNVTVTDPNAPQVPETVTVGGKTYKLER
jgi:hypothetical protein